MSNFVVSGPKLAKILTLQIVCTVEHMEQGSLRLGFLVRLFLFLPGMIFCRILQQLTVRLSQKVTV